MRGRLPAVAGALGILGSLACSVAMLMALVGLLGAGVASSAASTGDMAGMAGISSAPGPWPQNSSLPAPLLTLLFVLFQSGPAILVVSIVAIGLAVASRRRVALVPVVMAGLLLYWGMYLQSTRLVMYSAVAVGLAALFAAYFLSMRVIKENAT